MHQFFSGGGTGCRAARRRTAPARPISSARGHPPSPAFGADVAGHVADGLLRCALGSALGAPVSGLGRLGGVDGHGRILDPRKPWPQPSGERLFRASASRRGHEEGRPCRRAGRYGAGRLRRVVASGADQNTAKTQVQWAGLRWTRLDSNSGQNPLRRLQKTGKAACRRAVTQLGFGGVQIPFSAPSNPLIRRGFFFIRFLSPFPLALKCRWRSGLRVALQLDPFPLVQAAEIRGSPRLVGRESPGCLPTRGLGQRNSASASAASTAPGSMRRR